MMILSYHPSLGGSTGVPRVTIEERREILELRRGHTLEVRCSAQGSPRPQVLWSHGPNRERLPFNVSSDLKWVMEGSKGARISF